MICGEKTTTQQAMEIDLYAPVSNQSEYQFLLDLFVPALIPPSCLNKNQIA
jgi:hypothetical protein